MYQKYLDPQRQYADFVVGEETDIAAGILAAKVNQLFHAKVSRVRKNKGRK
jgi:uridine kinase